MSAFYQEGVYQCEVIEYGFAEAQTGTPQFIMKFKVVATEDNEPTEREYSRTFYRALTEKTMPYFVEDIKNLGWADITKPMVQLDPNESQFVDYRGNTALMYVKEVPDNKGGSKESWSVARSGGTQPLTTAKLDNAKKRALDNLFAAELRNQGGVKATTIPKPAATRPAARVATSASAAAPPPPDDFAPITDDDVPF